MKVGCIIPAVSSSLRLEETAEIHPQVKLHCFVSLSGKQNNNNDNKKETSVLLHEALLHEYLIL